MKHLKIVLVTLLVAVTASTLIFYKPIRVLYPEAFGVVCERNLCTDDAAQSEAAAMLYRAAKDNLVMRQGLAIGDPTIIFCSKEKCQSRFGLGKKAGYTFGAFGIAIAPRGWTKYYVAHELVHYWQAETFGSLVLLNGDPWLIEGMAYALSNDPRTDLHEPFESYRQRFFEWHRQNADIPFEASVGEVLASRN